MGVFDFLKGLVAKGSSSHPAGVAGTPVAFVERRCRPRLNARAGTRVLIIDDSPTVALALRRMLDSAGFNTRHAADAEKGLEQAREGLPDLIFLDIVLPGMSGFAALRALRHDSRTLEIPVIMMSGDDKAIAQFYCTRIGAEGFMRKPFSRYEVFSYIEQLLDVDRVPRRRPLRPVVVMHSGT